MCGRIRCFFSYEELAAATGVPQDAWVDQLGLYRPCNNIQPGAKWTPVMRMIPDGDRASTGALSSISKVSEGKEELRCMK